MPILFTYPKREATPDDWQEKKELGFCGLKDVWPTAVEKTLGRNVVSVITPHSTNNPTPLVLSGKMVDGRTVPILSVAVRSATLGDGKLRARSGAELVARRDGVQRAKGITDRDDEVTLVVANLLPRGPDNDLGFSMVWDGDEARQAVNEVNAISPGSFVEVDGDKTRSFAALRVQRRRVRGRDVAPEDDDGECKAGESRELGVFVSCPKSNAAVQRLLKSATWSSPASIARPSSLEPPPPVGTDMINVGPGSMHEIVKELESKVPGEGALLIEDDKGRKVECTRHLAKARTTFVRRVKPGDSVECRVGGRTWVLDLDPKTTTVSDCLKQLREAMGPEYSDDAPFADVNGKPIGDGSGVVGPMSQPLVIGRENMGHVSMKTLTGKIVSLNVNLKTGTVLDVKELYQDREGVPVDQQRVIADGRELDDEGTLASQGVVDKSVLVMCLRLCGGGGGAASARVVAGRKRECPETVPCFKKFCKDVLTLSMSFVVMRRDDIPACAKVTRDAAHETFLAAL